MIHYGTGAAVHPFARGFRHTLVMLIAVAGLGACGKSGEGPPRAPPPEVSVIKTSPVPVTLYEQYAAQTEAVEAVEIRARVSGILLRQAFQDGATVKRGDLLFNLDPDLFISALEQAKANLGQAQASWLNARQTLARLRPLLQVQAISQQDLDDAIARERADAASVEAAKAQVREAQLNLGYATIRAPRDGMINRALIKPGGLVNASTTLLTTLYSVDPIHVTFTISEQRLVELQKQYNNFRDPKLKTPMARLKLADGSDYRYGGQFDFLAPAVDPRNGTLPVRLVVPNPDATLRHGQFVRAVVPSREIPDAILVPQKAVQELQGKYSVYVLGPDNKATYRDITVGSRVGADWVVERGLRPGELVIVEGITKIKPGMVVKPAPAGQSQQAAPQPQPPQ